MRPASLVLALVPLTLGCVHRAGLVERYVAVGGEGPVGVEVVAGRCDGRQAAPPGALAPSGPATWHARGEGDVRIRCATGTLVLHVRRIARLELAAPPRLARGETATAVLTARDAAGRELSLGQAATVTWQATPGVLEVAHSPCKDREPAPLCTLISSALGPNPAVLHVRGAAAGAGRIEARVGGQVVAAPLTVE